MKLPHIRREQEAKFHVTDLNACKTQLDALSLLGYRAEGQGRAVEQDTYWDTPVFDLVRRGIALRLRRTRGRVTLGVKGQDGGSDPTIQDRIDFAVPWPRGSELAQLDEWPPAIAAALEPYYIPAPQDLAPIAYLHQVRRRHRIYAPGDDLPVVECSLDDVRVFAPGADGVMRPTSAFAELELERLPDGDSDQFVQLVKVVRADQGLVPLRDSKLSRALSSLSGEGAGVTPELDAAEACRRILHQQFLAILVSEHGVRADSDPEHVHDMRVAIRRARTAVRFFAPHFRKRSLRPHVRGLRKLGRALGAVRDMDVAMANLAAFRREQPRGSRKAYKPLRAAMDRARAAARSALLEYLDGPEHRSWLVEFSGFCQTTGRGVRNLAGRDHELPPRQVRHVFPGIILGCFQSVRAYEVAFAQGKAPELETFHRLRIACKYLRYSLEFAGHLLGEPGTAIVDQLKLLQDHLGDLNDAHVEQMRLARWADELSHVDAVGARLAALDARMAELTTAFPSDFARFVAYENRLALGTALAHL